MLKRVSQPGTFEKIRGWVLESRPGSPVILDGTYYVFVVDAVHVGAVGVKRLAWFASEIKHLVVAPEFRRRGHGRAILRLALEKVTTPIALATVRADQDYWLLANQREGFEPVHRIETPRGAVHLLWAAARLPGGGGGEADAASSSS